MQAGARVILRGVVDENDLEGAARQGGRDFPHQRIDVLRLVRGRDER